MLRWRQTLEMLIVGLGNPGANYAQTRHNAGFLLLDAWAAKHQISCNLNKFSALYGNGQLSGKRVHLLKPQTFMNLSGRSVQACMAFLKISPQEILVLHDELDLALGDVRVKQGGGHGGHNGLRSIIELCSSADFARLRIGIGRPDRGDAVAYVLNAFSAAQKEEINASFHTAIEAIDCFVQKGATAAMNFSNGLYKKAQKREESRSGQD